MASSANNRLYVGAALTFVFWLGTSVMYFYLIDPFGEGLVGFVLWVVIVLLAGLSTVMAGWFFPIYIVVALMKLHRQRREELEALGDENVVQSDTEGERKLHDYLTALGSLEARLGLVQKSDPWVPPEQRPPEDFERKPTRISRLGWKLFSYTVVAGITVGLVSAYAHGAGDLDQKFVGVIQFLIAGVVGGVLALPMAAILALVFGRTEDRESRSEDDARGSGSETA